MNNRAQFGAMPITQTVKLLMIANVSIWFVAQVLLERFGGVPFSSWFALTPEKAIFSGHIWQFVTYMFLHSLAPLHLVFNMLVLWWTGSELEAHWGRKFFLQYYLLSGIGAGLIYCLGMWGFVSVTSGNDLILVTKVLGASGAIFGLMLAYGILFGERPVHFMMIFPMKAKHMVMIIGAMEFAFLLTSDAGGGGVAYLAHIGGLIAGFLVLLIKARWQRFQWNKKSKKRGASGLKLVVDNESDKSPKYWN